MTHPDSPPAADSSRLLFLDGIRGWASLVVLFHHIIELFLGRYTPAYAHQALKFITDGYLAVCVFFVLSGFALTIKFIERPGFYSVAEAAASRYFRLVIPVFCSCLIAYLLLKAHLMFNVAAAEPVHSENWLGTFFKFDPSIGTLFVFSFYSAFFDYNGGVPLYNSNLWTMPLEFNGSMLAFFIAAVFLPKKSGGKVHILPISILGLYFFYANPLISCFVIGYLLAELYHARLKIMQTKWAAVLATLAFIIPIYVVTFTSLGGDRYSVFLAMLIVFSAGFSPLLKRACCARLSQFMGAISFPLYLVHYLVICSFSSGLFLYLYLAGYDPRITAHIVLISTLCVSLGAAYLFRHIERFSIFFSRIIGKKILEIGFARR